MPHSGLARRVALAREVIPEESGRQAAAGAPAGRGGHPARTAAPPAPQLAISASANPQVILILPGFGTRRARMRYLARQLEAAGMSPSAGGWAATGGRSPNLRPVEARLLDLHARHGRKVVLLGWSLGGLLRARAGQASAPCGGQGDHHGIALFSGSPRANNVWRAYQFITGHSVDAPPIEADLAAKPPVETVALWSANDGVIAPRCAAWPPGRARPRDCAALHPHGLHL
jgi:hypothetical protein